MYAAKKPYHHLLPECCGYVIQLGLCGHPQLLDLPVCLALELQLWRALRSSRTAAMRSHAMRVYMKQYHLATQGSAGVALPSGAAHRWDLTTGKYAAACTADPRQADWLACGYIGKGKDELHHGRIGVGLTLTQDMAMAGAGVGHAQHCTHYHLRHLFCGTLLHLAQGCLAGDSTLLSRLPVPLGCTAQQPQHTKHMSASAACTQLLTLSRAHQ